MQRICTLASLALALVFTACGDRQSGGETRFLSASDNDSTIKPGDDFYMYANGAWIKTAQILPTESSAGGFTDLYLRTQKNLQAILEEVSASQHGAGSIEQKVGDFFASGMDSAAIEKKGYDPVKPLLARIDTLASVPAVLAFVADEQKANNNPLFSFYVGADEKNSTRNIAVFMQGGLGLPDRDYYFKNDAATQAVVKAYQTYMRTLFTLTGDDSARAAARVAQVYALETRMAEGHRTNVELRDPQSNYNKKAVADLQKQMPRLGWTTLLQNMGIRTDSLNVAQPGFYAKIDELLASVPVDTWKSYLRYQVLDAYANTLSSPFVKARFEYVGKALNGQQQLKPRVERMVQRTEALLGEALGQLYVKKYFNAEAKKRMDELVENLSKAFEARIARLDWMSDSTKQKAREKLGTFLKKIGYPDKWRDYSQVTIRRDDFFGNVVSASRNEYQYQVNKVGRPVDKTEWQMTPPTINAYYNPTFNEIVFPAGILQFPFFDPKADDAINYGGIGMVIGHEMTHGFDDQGAQYDKHGNMVNWWSPADYEKFKAKGEAVVNLYNQFKVLDSLPVNGRLTLGENIADMGGLAIAYDAFKMTAQGKGNEKIDGLTPDQRFFLSYAQIWKSKYKEETARYLINVDPHAPDKYRVNGPLMNFTPFYHAFGLKPGDKMYKPENERIRIW